MALEKLLFESVNGQMDDGQKVITIAHPEHTSYLRLKMILLNFQWPEKVV